jgi:uncharacterized zinc-type alcohol dehydrogenase-like protein
MGVKIARALGAEVSLLSRSPGKQADAERLGAHHFYVTSEPDTFQRLQNHFDLIINTVSAPIDINAHLSLIDLDGALVNVGAPSEPLPVSAFSMIARRRSWGGSNIGGIAQTQEIDVAWDRVVASDVRYRFVIDTATF